MKQLRSATDWPLAPGLLLWLNVSLKSVSSREGMERTRQTSPYYQAWIESHEADLNAAEEAVKQNLSRLGELMEHSTLRCTR